jgi:hypothetical protein
MNEEFIAQLENAIQDLRMQVEKLQSDVALLSELQNKNNFSTVTVLNKNLKLAKNARIQLTNLTSDPTIGEVGDLVSVNGKLKICTVASTTAPIYTIVGTQT